MDENTETESSPVETEQETSATADSQPAGEAERESPSHQETSSGEEAASSKEAVEKALGLHGEEGEEPQVEPAKPEAQKPTVADAKKQEPGKDDLYKMPEDVKSPKAKERFQKLVAVNKEKDAAIADATARIETVRNAFQSTGCDNQEIVSLLDFGRMVKSGDRADLEKAYQIAENARRNLAIALGKTEAGAEVLPDDLKKRVSEFDLSEQDAYELAKARSVASQIENRRQLEQKHQRLSEDANRRIETARGHLNQIEDNWSKTDPHYAYKRDILLSKIPSIRDSYPPEYWPKVLSDVYASIPAPTLKRNPSPLRPGSMNGGKPVARSTADAVNAALGMG